MPAGARKGSSASIANFATRVPTLTRPPARPLARSWRPRSSSDAADKACCASARVAICFKPQNGFAAGTTISCEREWILNDRIGSGSFGYVYGARTEDGATGAVKLVRKEPGSDRELLFVSLDNAPNVVPIIDTGEYDQYHVLVMPLAEGSLKDHLDKSGALQIAEALDVLADVSDALVALEERGIVHRDIKPPNVLWLNGKWCLADFGIARYAEASTSEDTRMLAFSAPYAAPEQWRFQRATSATDIYSLGVVAFQMIAGARPFPGPERSDYREQHLHETPPSLDNTSPALAALIDECLYKAPEARPRPANFRARLARVTAPPPSAGLEKLQQANQQEVSRRGDTARRESAAQTETERREAIFEGALHSYVRIAETVLAAIVDSAPAAEVSAPARVGWTITLATGELSMAAPQHPRQDMPSLAFDTVAFAAIELEIPSDRMGYRGRSHSLWFADAQQARNYAWYETAFMMNPLLGGQMAQDPFALNPGPDALQALGPGIGTLQVAWPFTRLVVGELDDFISRWAGWLADAAEGRLSRPQSMPERETAGTWRQS